METQSEVKTQLSVGFAFLTALLYWSLILLAYFCNYAGIPWKNSNCREQGPVARVLTAQNWKEPKIGATLHCPSSQQLETLLVDSFGHWRLIFSAVSNVTGEIAVVKCYQSWWFLFFETIQGSMVGWIRAAWHKGVYLNQMQLPKAPPRINQKCKNLIGIRCNEAAVGSSFKKLTETEEESKTLLKSAQRF